MCLIISFPMLFSVVLSIVVNSVLVNSCISNGKGNNCNLLVSSFTFSLASAMMQRSISDLAVLVFLTLEPKTKTIMNG